MSKTLSGFLRGESGTVSIEYSILLLIIATAVVAGATIIGAKTESPFATLVARWQ